MKDSRHIEPPLSSNAAVTATPSTSATTGGAVSGKLSEARPRLDSIDLLRGLVMVLMALDHVRTYFPHATWRFSPADLSKTNVAWFLTRWVTHFCAPVFVFLAGTGAFLSLKRGKTKNELVWFLLTRGLWLVVVEVTIIRFARYFNFDYHFFSADVIWVIGWSMVALAGLIHLPLWATTLFGLVIIAGHHLLEGVRAESLGAFRWLWVMLYSSGRLEPLPGYRFSVYYTIIPWIGVMATGYGFGALLLKQEQERRKWLLGLGGALTLAFIALRATNLYGDPIMWTTQPSAVFTMLSFINCEKYPPSLLFLLMTLGPSIAVLPWFERGLGWFGRAMVTFGRVPLFYYILHFCLIHLLAVFALLIQYGNASMMFANPPRPSPGPGYGYSLMTMYLVWLAAILLLYPACLWFARFKQRRRDWWLSYF